ncbi:hypothetical protein JNUCC1_00167 [Lentibacillus sp. JNUCC-1]|nr:hypothetical protein [Lentibacillus sp. JNUCC-1]
MTAKKQKPKRLGAPENHKQERGVAFVSQLVLAYNAAFPLRRHVLAVGMAFAFI